MGTPSEQTSAPEAIFEERRTSRGGFLRKAGLMVAIGLGGSLAFARPAWAPNARCCRESCKTCPPNEAAYRCYDCDGSDCCQCLPDTTPPCQTYGCGGCG